MQSLLQNVFFDNTVQDYLILFLAIILVLLFRRYLSRYIASFIFRLLRKASWNLEKEVFVNLLRGPIHVFLLLLVIFLALSKLNYPSALAFRIYQIPFRQIVDSIANTILIIAFIWLLLRLIDFTAIILEQKATITPGLQDNQLVVFFKDFFKVIIIFIGFLLLIRFTFHKDIAALLAGFGIIGAALALSARESLENLIASFIIFFDKPFSHGDLVKVQNVLGTVERIGLRSTRIRTDQKTFVTVPNKQMVDSILDNWTLRTQRRGFLLLELSSGASYDSVLQLINRIEQFISANEYIQSYSVLLTDISKNSFVVQVEFFTGDIALEIFNDVRQEVNLHIIRFMEEMKIRLALRETEVIVTSSPP